MHWGAGYEAAVCDAFEVILLAVARHTECSKNAAGIAAEMRASMPFCCHAWVWGDPGLLVHQPAKPIAAGSIQATYDGAGGQDMCPWGAAAMVRLAG